MPPPLGAAEPRVMGLEVIEGVGEGKGKEKRQMERNGGRGCVRLEGEMREGGGKREWKRERTRKEKWQGRKGKGRKARGMTEGRREEEK